MLSELKPNPDNEAAKDIKEHFVIDQLGHFALTMSEALRPETIYEDELAMTAAY